MSMVVRVIPCFALFLSIGLSAGCSPLQTQSMKSPSNGPVEKRDVSSKEKMAMPTCKTAEDLESAYDTTCDVVGTYQLKEFYTKKKTLMASWPILVLSDGTSVMLESIWDKGSRHDEPTIQAHVGKKVTVRGMLHAEPPGAIANIAIPCVSPIDSMTLVSQP